MGGRRENPSGTHPRLATAADAAGTPEHRMTVARMRADTQEPCHGGRALEDLVRMVSALDGPRARALLSGLGEPLRARAVRLLTRLERSSRSDRHGRLADAFALQVTPGRIADGIPGRLGIEVRRGLAFPVPVPGPGSGPLGRWARRLMLEIGAP